MGSIKEDGSAGEGSEPEQLTGLPWTYGTGDGTWQARSTNLKERVGGLYDCRQMSDVCVLASDEKWWFGETVKDFSAHKFVLAASSPVLYHLFYELDEATNPDRRLLLDKHLGVTLTLVPCYDYVRLDMDGIPPVAAAGLLEYMYRDKFDEADFENGYSRNLLWRLWHASKALEMEHLSELCTKAIHNTMCEDTVFWDLNYAKQYNLLGTSDIMAKVLALSDDMQSKLFENPNFVWLEKEAIEELLRRRKAGGCDAMVVYNNLLRWSLYQVDRTACSEVDCKTGSEIGVQHRLEWIRDCREGKHDHVTKNELDKYLERGMAQMPWAEMSQKDFLEYVVPFQVLSEEELLKQSIIVMDIVVKNPDRLHNSAFHHSLESALQSNGLQKHPVSSLSNSPTTPRRTLSRTNSLRQSINDVKLRKVMGREGSRPTSIVSS